MSSTTQSPPTGIVYGGATTIEDINPDVVLTNILSRLDGPSLASTSCASSTLKSLAFYNRHLWSDICRSTWPSTTAPRLQHVISAFPPHGPRSFFSVSAPLLLSTKTNSQNALRLNELISAVDIHYRGNLIFSKVHVVNETETDWFKTAPFRIDMLFPKDVVSTPAQIPDFEDTCNELSDKLTLSWILLDPTGKAAVNLSSYKVVSVDRHWLSGDPHVHFDSILAVEDDKEKEFCSTFTADLVKCGITVTCGGSEGGEMQVREVSLRVEDIDGMQMNGEESMVILEGALRGKRGKTAKDGIEGKRRYEEFLERRRERRERKLRMEGRRDMMCVAFGITIFAAFWLFVLCT